MMSCFQNSNNKKNGNTEQESGFAFIVWDREVESFFFLDLLIYFYPTLKNYQYFKDELHGGF